MRKVFFKERVIIVFCAALYMLLINYIIKGVIYIDSPDGDLYLSIAQNFVNSGHFIQVSRPHELNFVVPFGLPLIYTALLILFGNLYAIVICQYIVFGVSACLISEIVGKVFKSKVAAYGSVVLFAGNRFITDYANPAYLLTETYTLFFILLWIYFFVLLFDGITDRKVILLLFISYGLFVIRPAFSCFLLFSSAVAIVGVLKKTISVRRLLLTSLIMIVILLVNVGVNYRETKTFVFLENYSGIAIYEANNINTKTSIYSSDVASLFVEDRFWSVENDRSLTRGEKSAIYNAWAKEYIKKATKECIKNTLKKFKYMFIKDYGFDFYISILAFLFFKRDEKRKLIVPYLLMMLCAVITSAGLYICRYSLVIAPIYIILKMGFLVVLFRKSRKIFRRVSFCE